MATPGDALRAQAEARLKVLARRVTAHLRFRGKTLQYPEDEILSSDARQSLVECVLRADGYDYADYDAADVDLSLIHI